MRYGINTPYFLQADEDMALPDLKWLADKLVELNIKDVRVPFSWFHLMGDAGDNGNWRPLWREKYHEFIDSLPRQINILAVPLHTPHSVAKTYFYDQSEISGQYTDFISRLIRQFPRITEWEIWNEPNASDFYLSVRDGKSHRPWTSDEFVSQLLAPAAKLIREMVPGAVICAPGLAENGIVGHKGKLPALSNRLPKTEEFSVLMPRGKHAHFYFIPDFANGFFKRLANVENGLIDAISYHPYPYWNIHSRTDCNLVSATNGLCSDFNNLALKYGVDKYETWISEIGARSFDVPNKHARDEQQQADYLDSLINLDGISKYATRFFWYKLIDRPFDLKQEKTFGLINCWGKKKKAFYSYKHHAASQQVKHFVDSFTYASDHSTGAFDPADWAIHSTSQFSYSTSHANQQRFGGILISPGREEADETRCGLKRIFNVERGDFCSVRVDFDATVKCPGITSEIQVNRVGTDENLVIGRFDPAGCKLFIAFPDKSTIENPMPSRFYEFVQTSGIKQISLGFGHGLIKLAIEVGGQKFYLSVATDCSGLIGDLSIVMTFTRNHPIRDFASISRFEVLAQPVTTPDKLPPVDNLNNASLFIDGCEKFSQIDQDQWVLRTFNYKTGGFFVEVGGHDGIANSNTYALERDYGWQGVIVEANPKHYRQVCQNRKCTAYNYAAFSKRGQDLEFVDAGAVGGLVDTLQEDIHSGKRDNAIKQGNVIKVPTETLDRILELSEAPEVIQYMSVDTEGSEYEVLQSCDFTRWKVALLTIEHGGSEKKRRQVNAYLSKFGYQRHRMWFEDWFYRSDILSELENIAGGTIDVEAALSTLPMSRKAKLAEQLKEQKGGDDNSVAIGLLKELIKDYYPDNASATIRYCGILLKQKRHQQAIGLLMASRKRFPGNQDIVRHLALAYYEGNRFVLLSGLLESALQLNPQFRRILEKQLDIPSLGPDLTKFFDSRPGMKIKYPSLLKNLGIS